MLIGIVGKPSSGKSTFLNAACLTNAKTANYPFTTIEPNLGTSFVRIDCVCKELNVVDNPKNSVCINGVRLIPIKLLDVAGLVPDAHKGKGMGNKFLGDLSRADLLIHVVDISGSLDAEGQEISEGVRDPLEDIQFLENEINYWFKDIITQNDWQRFTRRIQQEKLNFVDMLYERLAGISVKKKDIVKTIDQLKLDLEKVSDWTEENVFLFSSKLRENAKPILIAANKIDKPNSEEIYTQLKSKYHNKIIPCSSLAEYWLRQYEQKGILKYMQGEKSFEILKPEDLSQNEIAALKNIQEKILNKFNSTGIQDVLNIAVFEVLNNIVVYPVHDINYLTDKDGNVLPDVFLVTKGTKLKEFIEEKIHSDLAKNFIYGLNARTKMRLGEHYELLDKDIVKVVSATKSK